MSFEHTSVEICNTSCCDQNLQDVVLFKGPMLWKTHFFWDLECCFWSMMLNSTVLPSRRSAIMLWKAPWWRAMRGARLLLYSLLMVIFTTYVIISARISNGCVSALWIYDQDSLFSIRESIEGLFYTWGRYKQAFSPPFIIDPDSPEYLLLCRALGKARRKSRKRVSRSGVQVKRRRTAARLGSAILGHGERTRCLHRIHLLNVCDRTSTLLSAWATTEVLEPTQCWSGGQWLSLPPCSSVFTPVLPF